MDKSAGTVGPWILGKSTRGCGLTNAPPITPPEGQPMNTCDKARLCMEDVPVRLRQVLSVICQAI
jgi:hypothetical protein